MDWLPDPLVCVGIAAIGFLLLVILGVCRAAGDADRLLEARMEDEVARQRRSRGEKRNGLGRAS